MSYEHVSRSCLSWNLQTWIISHVNLLSRPKNILGPGVRSRVLWGGEKGRDKKTQEDVLCSTSLQKRSGALGKDTCSEQVRTLEIQGGNIRGSQG